MIDVIPLGCVMAYAGDITAKNPIKGVTPAQNSKTTSALLARGWAYCNGQEINKMQYNNLYDVIGDIYGTSSHDSTFCLPDYRGYFFRAVANGKTVTDDLDTDRTTAPGGIAGGVGSTQTDQFQRHEHEYKGGKVVGTVNAESGSDSVALKIKDTLKVVEAKGFGAPRSGKETRPINIAVNYIIKIKTFGVPLHTISVLPQNACFR